MAVAALLVVGVVAYTRIPLDLVPGGLEGDRLYVRAGYADASPAEVEREVTRPLEEAIATVPRVGRVISGANRDGAWANVQFLPGTDMHEAYADLRDRIDRAMPELPEEIERVQVLRWNQDDWPVMWIGASLEGEFADAFQLLDVHVRPALQRIEGVGTVEVRGEEARQVRIELDQGRLRGHGVSPYEVGRRLASLNFALPGGRVMEGGAADPRALPGALRVPRPGPPAHRRRRARAAPRGRGRSGPQAAEAGLVHPHRRAPCPRHRGDEGLGGQPRGDLPGRARPAGGAAAAAPSGGRRLRDLLGPGASTSSSRWTTSRPPASGAASSPPSCSCSSCAPCA